MMTSVWSECSSLLRCPVSGDPLTLLQPGELDSINDAIGKDALVHADGSRVVMKLTQLALGSSDRRYIYRLEDGIPWLLPALAIVRVEDATMSGLERTRQVVQTFYDEFGWVKNNTGFYNDTSEFTDVRPTSQNYASACNTRIATQLNSGTYLLDAASGAIPNISYVEFSKNYKYRVCLDFSIRALREAQVKLGQHGLCVLGDLTNLPFASGSIDDVISLHTLYHIPAADQATAIAELVRVVRPGGRAVVVSKWDKSPLMDWVARFRNAGDRVKRSTLRREPAVTSVDGNRTTRPPLYYSPSSYSWFAENVRDRYRAELRLWSSTGTDFHKRYFSDTTMGRLMANVVLAVEGALEPLAARLGEYPMFVISKDELIPNRSQKSA